MKSGVMISPSHDGWFVPDAVWLDINNALAKEVYEPKK